VSVCDIGFQTVIIHICVLAPRLGQTFLLRFVAGVRHKFQEN